MPFVLITNFAFAPMAPAHTAERAANGITLSASDHCFGIIP